MASQIDLAKLSVEQFAERFRSELIPLNNRFSYFVAGLPFSEEDVREYLEEPAAALPPEIVAMLPRISILLVPFLERAHSKEKSGHKLSYVTLDAPPENRAGYAALLSLPGEAILAFAVKDQEVADYHYRFYHGIATLVAEYWNVDAQLRYSSLLREELSSNVHGEVDEESWALKQAILRRQTNVRRDTKSFRDYARQSFVDTLTLYLHGICCDIDVETGPRQLPSRHLRKRLQLLLDLYPPPEGYAVFPEDLNRTK